MRIVDKKNAKPVQIKNAMTLKKVKMLRNKAIPGHIQDSAG